MRRKLRLALGPIILLIGPPGSGKTMLSRRLPTILPAMSLDESLETTRIYSASGLMPAGQALIARRPVRAPHHTASGPALIGGGTVPAAGEISLANHGVLFLDEFAEFPRTVLETLRQPLEDGVVTIARSHSCVQFPARFMLVAAMNPCPCGYFGSPDRVCRCSPGRIEKYLSRVSGPLIDRIDIHVEVPTVSYRELRSKKEGTSSAQMADKVRDARQVQAERLNGSTILRNAHLRSKDIRRYCPLSKAAERVLKQAMLQLGLSARAHDKILKIARTIADLAACENIRPEHVTEAIHYRRLDRQL